MVNQAPDQPGVARITRAFEPRDIVELYAYVIKEPNGGEGLAAHAMKIGAAHFMMPLIGADLERVQSLAPFAQSVETMTGQPVALRHFALSTWLPIDTAPHKPGEAFDQPRVELWIPATQNQPGFATHGHYCADTYAKKPRPYWNYEAAIQVSSARARQPTHWRPEPQGPTP